MSAAIEQITAAAAHAAKRGMKIVGYRPKTGCPHHPDGSVILDIELEPIAKQRTRQPAALPEPAPKIITRGARAGTVQPTLL